jgi:hypothetical protein
MVTITGHGPWLLGKYTSALLTQPRANSPHVWRLMYGMPVRTRIRPGRRACDGLGVGFGVARGVGLGVDVGLAEAVGRAMGDGAADASVEGEPVPSANEPMVAMPFGQGSPLGEGTGNRRLGPGITVGRALGCADRDGWALVEALGLAGGRQSAGRDGLALAGVTEADGESDGSVVLGAAARPVNVTVSAITHAPRTAAHTGGR